MKKLIISELLLLFLATTFMTDSLPPGWYQQTLPVNDQLNDIFFLDSLTGWVVTAGASSGSDTGYVMKTTNGGSNWVIQYNEVMDFRAVQFLNSNTGYIAGGVFPGKVYKTTNSGTNWINISSFASQFYDIFFVNKDTGWVADANGSFGGLFKTINGGTNWFQQMPGNNFPQKLFFINRDTGWAGSNEANGKLYRTTNGGANWNWQYTSNIAIVSIFFLNGQKGWIRGGTGNGVMYTTDGGFNWTNAQGNIATGFDTKFINDTLGYSGTYSSFKIMKSTDGGQNWGYQVTPILSANLVSILKNDTSNAWAGQIMHTFDGGGPITFTGIQQINTEIPSDYKLYQNYPNPFNPGTNIKYQIVKSSSVKLVVFDITGRELVTIVNQKQNPGTYQADFDGAPYSSGVYFYSLIVDGKLVETRKMILIK